MFSREGSVDYEANLPNLFPAPPAAPSVPSHPQRRHHVRMT